MEGDNINLVGRQMCEECDAFLGKAHKDTCSKAGRLVEMGDATEKFTTAEDARDQDGPLIGMDVETVGLLLKWLSELDLDDPEEIAKLNSIQAGFVRFTAAAKGAA